MTSENEQHDQLEKLLLDEDLEEVELLLKEFNIFTALNVSHLENIHSNFMRARIEIIKYN